MPPDRPALSVTARPSPNHGERRLGVRFVVLHYTGMATAEAALARLCDPAAAVSAHYLIDEAGACVALVPEDRRAWHAGVAYWRGVRDVNSASIGVELVNPGHDFGYRAFPAAQIDALKTLLRGIVARYGLTPGDVIGHSDVAPGRKLDPGELFPWAELARDGFGVWPELRGTKGLLAREAALRLLSSIGYAVPLAPELGADILSAPADCIAAFQRHYRPARIDGVLDLETQALIQARAAASAVSA